MKEIRINQFLSDYSGSKPKRAENKKKSKTQTMNKCAVDTKTIEILDTTKSRDSSEGFSAGYL